MNPFKYTKTVITYSKRRIHVFDVNLNYIICVCTSFIFHGYLNLNIRIFCYCMDYFGFFYLYIPISQSISEWIKGFFFHIPVSTVFHRVIGKFRHTFQIPIESDRQFSGRRYFAKEQICHCFSASCTWIPCQQDTIAVFICIIQINGTSCHQNYNDWFSYCCYLFNQFFLHFWKMKVFFVSGCVFISFVSFFSFQCLIQTDTENYHITVFCSDHSFGNTILIPCKVFHFAVFQRTSFGIQYTNILPYCILNAFQNSNISGSGSMIISN